MLIIYKILFHLNPWYEFGVLQLWYQSIGLWILRLFWNKSVIMRNFSVRIIWPFIVFFFRTCRNDCCTICVLSFDLQGYLKSVLMIPCCIAYRDGSTKEEPKELSTKARGATNLQAIIEAIDGFNQYSATSSRSHQSN